MALSNEWRSDLILMMWVLIFVVASVIVPKILKEKGIISKFIARKIIHSFSGLAIFSAPYLYHPILAVITALMMTFLTRLSSKKSKNKQLKGLFDAISEEEELYLGYLQGPFAYCLAISILTFSFIFFPDKYYFPISAVLIMMYADTLASHIGRKYGKHHINIPFVGNKRTLEGSLSFFIVAIMFSLPTFLLLGMWMPGFSTPLTIGQIFTLSFSISIISTFLELFSPSKYDDLIVPLGATILISLIAILMGLW